MREKSFCSVISTVTQGKRISLCVNLINVIAIDGNSGKNDKYKERVFPYLVEKKADTFNFGDCSFAVQKAKEATARVVVWKELGITNSYTLESSFCGSDFGKFSDLHFNTDMLQQIGHKFCQTIIEFCQPDNTKIK